MSMYYPAPDVLDKFEQYYQDKKNQPRNFQEDKMEVRVPGNIPDTIAAIKSNIQMIEHSLFEVLMQLEWLQRKVGYNGKVAQDFYAQHGHLFDYAMGQFFQTNFGFTASFWNSGYAEIIRNYADDFFPDFNTRTLEDGFPYPYKTRTFEDLFYVHKVPGRKELLDEGEKYKMDYFRFRDYILACGSRWQIENEKECKPYYTLVINTPPYYAEVISLVERLKRRKKA